MFNTKFAWPLVSAITVLALILSVIPEAVSAQAPACAANVPGPLPFFIITAATGNAA